jgi:hypothetical protein
MPYCGQFGCRCCSAPCEKCGKMRWYNELEDGICYTCINEEKATKLELKVERQRKVIKRLCQMLKIYVKVVKEVGKNG